jgi:hypothetical protein
LWTRPRLKELEQENANVEHRRHLPQNLVRHGPHRTRRMILPHTLFRRQIPEYMSLLMINPTHAQVLAHLTCAKGVVFQQPARPELIP